MNKYMFRITEKIRNGERTTIHEFFGTSQETAEAHIRERFGPDAQIEFVKETD